MVRGFTLCSLFLVACDGGKIHRSPKTLSVLLSEAPDSLDPRRGSSAVEHRVQALIFRSLVRVADDLSVTEDLAQHIDAPDAQTLKITLNSGVRFHPCFDGTPGGTLKAEDVAYSYDSLREPEVGSRKQRILADVERIEVPDPGGLELTFHLRKPRADWLSENGTLGLIEKACARKDPKAFARHPSGTGALAFGERIGDHRLILKRFDPRLAFDTMELRIVADETSRLLELLKGRADVLTVTPSRPLLAPIQRRPEFELISAPGNGYSYLAFNLRVPKLADLKVRRAIGMAIDRAAIIEHKYLGLARPSAAMTPPDHWAHPQGLGPLAFDPKGAAKLLDEAGYRTNPALLDAPGGNAAKPTLHIEMRTTPEKFGRALSLVVQDQLRHVGIDLELRINDWGTLYSQVKKGNFQLVRMEWVPVLSPALLDWVFHSDAQPDQAGPCQSVRDCPGTVSEGAEASSERYSCSAKVCVQGPECEPGCSRFEGRCVAQEAGVCRRNGGNRGHYENAEVDRLLEEAAATVEQQGQGQRYQQVQRILARELPYLSLWHEDRVWIVRRPWTGVELKASGSLRGLLGAKRMAEP